jgi:hypothetical protein
MRVKIKNVYYCKHPDFIQDDSDPKGYKVLDTAKWVVEWDVVPFYLSPSSFFLKEHYRASFPTEEQARSFYKDIMKRINPEEVLLSEELSDYVKAL